MIIIGMTVLPPSYTSTQSFDRDPWKESYGANIRYVQDGLIPAVPTPETTLTGYRSPASLR